MSQNIRSSLLIYEIYAWLLLPIFLLSVAWRRNKREKATFALLLVSGILLLSATVPDIKWVLLGRDYTNRLYVTIGLNMLLAAACGLYLAFTRRFLAALSAIVLVFGWLYMGVVNLVV
jgi:hypothetical protein